MKETKNIDLNTLIHRPLKAFFDRRIEPSDISPADEEEKIIPTTFRLPADIKNYYQMMGDASRTTLQGAVLQVLNAVMESHTINQRAERYARDMSHRFFQMFDAAGIPISKIPAFLKNFNITREDLTSDYRIVDLMSDEVVDFLADTFLLNKEWITGEKNNCSHQEIHGCKNSRFIHSIMQQSPYDLTLKVLFDDSILSDPSLRDNKACRREVYCGLVEEPILNNVRYKRMYLFKPIIWDRFKANITIASLVEGIELQQSLKRKTEFFAYSSDDVDTSNLGTALLTDFIGFGKNGSVKAAQPAEYISSSKSTFTKAIKTLKSSLEAELIKPQDLSDNMSLLTLLALKESKLGEACFWKEFKYLNGELKREHDSNVL